MSERPDPRHRPPDPAGTQPKYDPESLLPQPLERAIDTDAIEEPEDAVVVSEHETLPELREPAGALAATAAVEEPPHAPRFQFLFGALLAIGIVALAGIGLVIANGGAGSDDGPAWSPWKPSGDDPIASIAEHVGREYRLPNGEQLVHVTPGPLEAGGVPLHIALREAPTAGGDINLVEGDGVLYRLCGLGPQCSINRGKPSEERLLLLRREALELALYTFRYADDVDNVVVFMPPPPGQEANVALLFRKGDVAPELARPLRATLSRRTPSVAGVATAPDSPLVNRITAQLMYAFSLTQANQEAAFFLVLEPPEVAAARQQQEQQEQQQQQGQGSPGDATPTTTTGTSGKRQ
jgi:hypothetical protein